MANYKEQYNSFLNELEREMTDEERKEAENSDYYHKLNEGTLSDMELARFMSDKIDNIHEIIRKSDKIVSRDGQVEKKSESVTFKTQENQALKQEIDGLKDEIRELKNILVEKISELK